MGSIEPDPCLPENLSPKQAPSMSIGPAPESPGRQNNLSEDNDSNYPMQYD